MAKRKTKEWFVEKASIVHKNKYEYSLVEYKGTAHKVNITCPHHGIFKQEVNSHFRGSGCPICASEKVSKFKKSTTQKFIETAKNVHGDKYDYSSTDYENSKTKVDIICSIHGIFQQEANSHLKGSGCKKCNIELNTKKVKDYIEQCKKVHKGVYNYEQVKYKRGKDKVTIVCKKHGDFKQEAKSHLLGSGCPKCKVEYNLWTYDDWQKSGEKSKNYDSFKVYIIRCWNDEEEFYKIGKTFRKIKERFSGERMPYKYSILKVYTGEARNMSQLENTLQNLNKEFKYLPKIEFGGMYECFIKIKNYDL